MKSSFALALAVGAASAANLRTPVTGASAMDYGLTGTATTGGATGMNYGLTGAAASGGASETDYGLTGTTTTGHHGATYGTAMPSYDETTGHHSTYGTAMPSYDETTGHHGATYGTAMPSYDETTGHHGAYGTAMPSYGETTGHHSTYGTAMPSYDETTGHHGAYGTATPAVPALNADMMPPMPATDTFNTISVAPKTITTYSNKAFEKPEIKEWTKQEMSAFYAEKEKELAAHTAKEERIAAQLKAKIAADAKAAKEAEEAKIAAQLKAKEKAKIAACVKEAVAKAAKEAEEAEEAKYFRSHPFERYARMEETKVEPDMMPPMPDTDLGLADTKAAKEKAAKENAAKEKAAKEKAAKELARNYSLYGKECKIAVVANAAKEVIWKSTKYYITELNENCEISSNVITSQAECKIALFAVGKSDRIEYNGVWNHIPGGCSVRGHSAGHYDNRGKKGTVGAKRWDLRAVCKGDKATSITFHQQKVLKALKLAKEKVAAHDELVASMSSDDPERIQTALLRCHACGLSNELSHLIGKAKKIEQQLRAAIKIQKAAKEAQRLADEKKATYEKNKYVQDPICTNHLHASRKLLNQADIVISSIIKKTYNVAEKPRFGHGFLGGVPSRFYYTTDATQKKAENGELKKITSGMGYLKEAMAQLDLTRYSHGAVNTVQEDRNGELEHLILMLRNRHDLLQRMAKAWQTWILKKHCVVGNRKYQCLGPAMKVYTSSCGGQYCYDSGIKLVHEPLRRLIEDGSKKTSWVPEYACGSKKTKD